MKNVSKERLVSDLVKGQSPNSIRAIALLFVVSSALLRLIYDYYLPDFKDSFGLRWGLTGVVGLFFLSTYTLRYSPKRLSLTAIFLYTLILFYSVYLVIINDFHPFAVTILMLVMMAGTILINSTAFYLVQSILVLLIVSNRFTNLPFNDVTVIALYSIVFTIAVCGTILFVRLKMMENVNFSNSLLEKINLFAIVADRNGEILYVSPSVTKILGCEPRNLIKQGWWNDSILSTSWIEKEYIVNYPGLIPVEIESFVKRITLKDGRMVRLNWTNSILPNGEYMGTALVSTEDGKERVEENDFMLN